MDKERKKINGELQMRWFPSKKTRAMQEKYTKPYQDPLADDY